MAMRNEGVPGIDFQHFKRRLDLETLNDTQRAMLNTRLQLLESFMYHPEVQGNGTRHRKNPHFDDSKQGKELERQWWIVEDAYVRAKIGKTDIWSFEPGSLTIVDLSCPFVDATSACAMFDICLALFLEHRANVGRIIALDEAHKVCRPSRSRLEFIMLTK